jgi:hypothetical protein
MFKLNKLVFCVLSLVCLPAWSAPDPHQFGLPIGAKLTSDIQSTAQPLLVKMHDGYLLTSNSPLVAGGIFGFISKTRAEKTRIVVSLPFEGDGLWNSNIGTGLYYAIGGMGGVPILSNTASFVLDPKYPFNWGPTAGDARLVYNGLIYVPAQYPNLKGNNSNENNPRGAQVQPEALSSLADALMSNKSIDIVSIDVYSISSLKSVRDFEYVVTKTGSAHRSIVHVLPALDGGELIAEKEGLVAITAQKALLSVPKNCEILNAPKGMACTLDLTHLASGFSLKTTVAGVGFLKGSSTSPVMSISVAPDVRFYYSMNYLNQQLGQAEEKELVGLAPFSLAPNAVPEFASPFDLFEKLILKRMNFQVSITERQPAVNGYYQGQVGKNPNITIPYLIKQSGASKASKVTMSVSGDSTTQDGDGRQYCKFLTDSKPVQSIAVPLALAFSKKDGSLKKEVESNCSGTELNITDMPWSETQGNQFMGELWMDMIFNISNRRILNDIEGKYWAGSAKAKGEIKVKATWND